MVWDFTNAQLSFIQKTISTVVYRYSLTITQLPFENLHNFTQKAPHIHFYINRTMVEIINQFISAHPVVNFCYFMVYERSKDLQWRLLRFYKWLSTHTPVVINECKINFYYLKLYASKIIPYPLEFNIPIYYDKRTIAMF